MSDDFMDRVARRWQTADRLLPAPWPPGPDQQVIEVPGACGVISHSTAEPGTPKPMWFAADRFWLGPLIAGDDAGAAMDALLAAWHRTIAPELETAGPDSACYVTYPSREDQVFPALGRHGLTPHVIIAARPAKRSTPPGSAGTARVRRATAGDLDAIGDIAVRQAREEQRYGTAWARPDAAAQVRREPEVLLREPDPWIWLAEVDGRPVGLVTLTPPEHNEWLHGYADHRPLAYLSTAYLDPTLRGGGIGAALVNAAHQMLDEAGVALTLLHYAVLNPYSGPFWHRMGYRPLWTGWSARPANRLR